MTPTKPFNCKPASAPAARVMAELDGETRAQALAAGRKALAEHQGDNGIELGAAVWIVSATAS